MINMATASAPKAKAGLRTPAPDLRRMAVMAGVQEKETRGVEKNDLLASLEVKVSDTITKKAATMLLSLEDLFELLIREGMGRPDSARAAVVLLGKLRLREMNRLCYTDEDGFQKEKQRLEEMQLHLAILPDEEVKSYFRKPALNVPTPCGASSREPESSALVSPGSCDCTRSPVESAVLLKQQESVASPEHRFCTPAISGSPCNGTEAPSEPAPAESGPPSKQKGTSIPKVSTADEAISRASVGLQTPAPLLRNMALKAGIQEKDTWGVEKNDLLASLEIKVSDTITKKATTMQLSLDDVCDLLMREGVGKPESAKEAVMLLAKLRLREMERLSYTNEEWLVKEKKRLDDLQLHLALLPEEEVKNYFLTSTSSVRSFDCSSSPAAKSVIPAPPISMDHSTQAQEVRAPSLKGQLTSASLVSADKGTEASEVRAPALKRQRTDGLRAIFDKIDIDGNQDISRIEFIKACRKDPSIAEYFGIKSNIRETNGGRDCFESIFQSMDVDNDTKISWDEFHMFCQTKLHDCLEQMNTTK